MITNDFYEGYVDDVTGRVAVKVSTYANSDLNGDTPAYVFNPIEFDLEPWRLVEGVDQAVDGSSFEIWGVANWSKEVDADYLIFLSRAHYHQLMQAGLAANPEIQKMLTPLEMIEEWRKGCSCAGPAYDRVMGNQPGTTPPEQCLECTRGLIDALEVSLRGGMLYDMQSETPT